MEAVTAAVQNGADAVYLGYGDFNARRNAKNFTLEELRRLAYTDLDKALLLGCELTIADMEERGVPVHSNTLQARNYLRGRA